MPKDLTDASLWADVSVPVDTDPADAASVESPFQDLADRTKYLRDRMGDNYLNLNEADTTSIATLDLANVMAGCMVSNPTGARVHTIIDDDGVTAICMHPGEATPSSGGGGVYWDDEADSPQASLGWTLAGSLVDVCGAWPDTGNRERVAVSNSANSQVSFSSTHGSWSSVSSVPGALKWSACEMGDDGARVWVIGGAAGAMATSPSPSVTAFTSRTSGLTGAVVRIRSNRKESASHRFLALDDAGNVSISNSDGSTWTVTLAGALGLTSTLESIAWDAVGDRWVGIQYNGYRAWSTDGITWAESALARLQSFVPSASNKFFLDADDQGHVMLGIHRPGTRSEIYVSPDIETADQPWEEAYWPSHYAYAKILFMGHGKLITAGSAGVLYSDEAFTTRWGA